MKKILLLGLILISLHSINAQVSIKVIDAGNDIVLENVELVRKNKRGKILEKKFTNNQGIVTFKKNSGLVVMTEKSKKYRHFPIDLWRRDKNKTLIYYAYPTKFLEYSLSNSSQDKKSNIDHTQRE